MNSNAQQGRVLFVVSADPAPNVSDEILEQRMTDLGYKVVRRDCREASAARVKARKISLIVISPSAPPEVGKEFREVAVPLVAMRGVVYSELGMVGESHVTDFGEESSERPKPGEKTNILIIRPNHPMAAGLLGDLGLSESAIVFGWARPGRMAHKVACLTADTEKVVLFGYDSGDRMSRLNAPARRVGLFFDPVFAKETRSAYWQLFDAAIGWAAGEHPRRFSEVFRAEWGEINTRRKNVFAGIEYSDSCPPTHPPQNLTGLALSGGGIRAATFSLGLLQGMHRLGVLRYFDYFSTVSGGGYAGGWWSAWLSRDTKDQRGGAELFPPRELIRPEGEGVGRNAEQRVNTEVADELLSAGHDPIHHLRLFANYLTPRKGVLSPDTWRAVTVIARNMALTWVVLLPILIAALLLGKLYFVLRPLSYYRFSAEAFFLHTQLAPAAALRARLILLAWPLLVILGWLVVAVCAWMVAGAESESRRERWAGRLGGVVVTVVIGLCLYLLFFNMSPAGGPGVPVWVWAGIAAGGVAMVCYFLYPWVLALAAGRNPNSAAELLWQNEVRRQRIARVQAKLLVVFLMTAFVLVLAGFGHELINYVIDPSSGPVAKAGGWLAVLLAFGGSIFTAVKNSPSGGSDERLLSADQSMLSRLVFRLTPLLVLLVLAAAVSWAANMLLSYIHWVYIERGFLSWVASLTVVNFNYGALGDPTGAADPVRLMIDRVQLNEDNTNLIGVLAMITSIGILLSFYLVLVETKWKVNRPRVLLNAFCLVLAVYLGLTLFNLLLVPSQPAECGNLRPVELLAGNCGAAMPRAEGEPPVAPSWANWWCFFDHTVCLDLRLLGALMTVVYLTGWWLIFRLRRGERWRPSRLVPTVLTVLIGAALGYLTLLAAQSFFVNRSLMIPLWLAVFIGGCFVFCLLYAVLETRLGRTDNKRALWLLASVYLVLVAQLAVTALVDYTDIPPDLFDEGAFNRYVTVLLGQGAFGLFGVALTWVVAMGWMADPNQLSLHSFYRARLVRAYLGASNKYRSERLKTIREAVEGDDVMLQGLRNCKRGAPYHLINTTLNLVGGRDLTSAQRSADAFVFSKLYCGSSRTGYRDTREYMGGRLSLGTAVAVSGAAASPNMGAKTLTASLAMLMTFLNVRLGYWAPTPNKKDWRATKARLWPFYVMREFTSQTNDLSTYCYLTDGGHFDNTGLYSLVERGCRFIVVADAGADPKPCFQDLGDAIRRCRIDFGAEIKLDLTPLMRDKEDGTAQAHFSVGTIVYSREHAESLKWALPPKDDAEAELTARSGVVVVFKPALTRGGGELADVRQYKLENSLFPQQTTVDQWFDESQFESYRRLGQFCAHAFYGKLEEGQRLARVRDGKLTADDIEALFLEASVKYDDRSPFLCQLEAAEYGAAREVNNAPLRQ